MHLARPRSTRPLTRPPASSVRWLAAVLVALAVPLVLASACTPRPTVASLDRKVFATPLPEFARWWRSEQAIANHVPVATIDRWWRSAPERLDWAAARRRPFDVSTDLCSFAPERGPAFDFRLPCVRHDFAWRNLKRLQAITGGSIDTHVRRLSATRQFLRDMRTTCAARPSLQRAACSVIASTYYRVVAAVS